MKVAILVLFASFLGSTTAQCSSSLDCPGMQLCCGGGYCSSSCLNSLCLTDSDCGYEECCSDNKCRDCAYLTTGGVVGLVIASLFVVIVACFCCACCPYYRYRHPGTVIVTGQPPYQQFVTTTSTTSQHMQHPPPAAYGQPPPYYPQPQAGPYPPPQAQAQ